MGRVFHMLCFVRENVDRSSRLKSVLFPVKGRVEDKKGCF